MQKKIIALAIASALTAPALAFADATVYGQANLSVDMINDGNSPSGKSNNLVSNNSRVGVKGSEDLGGGLSTVWQMEGSVGMDKGTTTVLFDRNTYLGLSSADMGTVVLGQHDTPYKMATRKLDVFADTVAADNRRLMGAGHDARVSNAIAYISPSMSGMSVAAATVFGNEGANSASKKGSLLSLAGMYEQGPIYATLAYDSVKYGNIGDLAAPAGYAAGDKSSAFKLGGGYTMDAITVNAVIEKTTVKIAPAADSTGTNLYLAGKFSLSSTDAVKLAYTKRGDTTGKTNNATQISVGYDHGMSKATSVYALYSKVTQNATGAADPSTVSAGIKHSF